MLEIRCKCVYFGHIRLRDGDNLGKIIVEGKVEDIMLGDDHQGDERMMYGRLLEGPLLNAQS